MNGTLLWTLGIRIHQSVVSIDVCLVQVGVTMRGDPGYHFQASWRNSWSVQLFSDSSRIFSKKPQCLPNDLPSVGILPKSSKVSSQTQEPPLSWDLSWKCRSQIKQILLKSMSSKICSILGYSCFFVRSQSSHFQYVIRSHHFFKNIPEALGIFQSLKADGKAKKAQVPKGLDPPMCFFLSLDVIANPRDGFFMIFQRGRRENFNTFESHETIAR